MEKWLVTGVSGCGRIEFLNDIAKFSSSKGKKVAIHDVGELISKECINKKVPLSDNKILDIDNNLLKTLRSLALKEIEISILKEKDIDLHLIGVHALFPWKGRLIPGISYSDIKNIQPDGILNIVDNVNRIHQKNQKNQKWDTTTLPDLKQTQEWMLEEEFVSQIISDVMDKPMYLIAKDHRIENIHDMFFTKKKKIYLSYPITAVKTEQPDLLEKIQGPILEELEKLFIVFNPLAIKDMSLISDEKSSDIPDTINELDSRAQSLIKSRTIERDYRFIDQSDAVVVFYETEKVSPGVLAEIFYAHRNQKPVFVVFKYSKSPFLEDAVTSFTKDIDSMMPLLKEFAKK